jgi:hypothetical protein
VFGYQFFDQPQFAGDMLAVSLQVGETISEPLRWAVVQKWFAFTAPHRTDPLAGTYRRDLTWLGCIEQILGCHVGGARWAAFQQAKRMLPPVWAYLF